MRNPGKVLLLLVFAASLALLLSTCGGSSSTPTGTSSLSPRPLASGLAGADNQILSETLPGSLPGSTDNAYFGFSVASGDFDGDGFIDLAAGIPFDNNEQGAVNVFRGTAAGISESDVQRWKQGAAGIGGTEEPGDRFGYSLAAGDFNGDNVADLAIGVPGDNTAGGKTGSVHILYGSKTIGLGASGSQIWSQDDAAVPGDAEPGDSFGYSLAVGDFNNDGYADLAIGVPGDNTAGVKAGAVNVLYGSATGLGLGSPVGQIWSQGGGGAPGVAEPDDQFGFSLTAGDFDKDGFADLAIGVPGDNTALGRPGAVNVLYGSSSGLGSSGSRIWSQGSGGAPGVAEPDDQFGFSLAAGDFNKDGFADLAVGVPGDNTAGVKAGAVNVLYGSATGLGVNPDSPTSRIWSRESDGVLGEPAEGDRFGHSLASGDFDGTGFDDLAIGVPGDDIGGAKDAGSVSVLYGSATGITTLHNQLWDQTGLGKDGGVEALDAFGSALAAGDFDGDGVADLAIGVPGEDVEVGIVIFSNAGSVDVLYGTVNHPPVANAGADQTVPVSNDNCFALVQLDGTGSSDPDGDPLTYVWTWSGGTLNGPTPQIVLTLGSYTFTLTVDDGFGGTDTDNVVVTVVDRTPPVILGIEANPEVLWPPNHKYVPVTFTVRAKDNCDATPFPKLESVSSNEPVNGHGDGNTAPDWIITGDLSADIRAERSGTGSGRVYTATITVTDDSGNVARGTEGVEVPHDQR
jgi:hypothetical protein